MNVKRRTYLALVGSTGMGGAAGCVSSQPWTADDETPAASPETVSPTPVAVDTPPPGECEAVSPPKPSTSAGLPDAKSYPEPPKAFDKPTVMAFLEAYERAHRYNSQLAALAADGDCVRYLDMHVTEATISTTENGFEAAVTTRGSYTGSACPGVTGTDTPTPAPHADLAGKTGRYLVTRRFLIRNGVVRECWE